MNLNINNEVHHIKFHKDEIIDVRIIEVNKDKIAKKIKQIEHKCRVNLLKFDTLVDLSKDAEESLADLNIPIKSRSGSMFYYQPEGPWANAYKNTQGATAVYLLRKTQGWYVHQADRINVYPKSPEKKVLYLTEEQRDIAVSKLCLTFKTIADAKPEEQ